MDAIARLKLEGNLFERLRQARLARIYMYSAFAVIMWNVATAILTLTSPTDPNILSYLVHGTSIFLCLLGFRWINMWSALVRNISLKEATVTDGYQVYSARERLLLRDSMIWSYLDPGAEFPATIGLIVVTLPSVVFFFYEPPISKQRKSAESASSALEQEEVRLALIQAQRETLVVLRSANRALASNPSPPKTSNDDRNSSIEAVATRAKTNFKSLSEINSKEYMPKPIQIHNAIEYINSIMNMNIELCSLLEGSSLEDQLLEALDSSFRRLETTQNGLIQHQVEMNARRQ